MDKSPISPPNILVVDDVSVNLVILSEMIKNAGYIARPVMNVEQAQKAIEALTPSLVLMDISMPETDGYEFCSMLKKNVNTRDIPVIFISALNSTEDKIKGFQLGAVDYITKPFEVDEVTMRINTHLKLNKMHQELEEYNKKLYKIINDQINSINLVHKEMLKALAKALIARDSSQKEHMEHVAKNSKLLAMSLQLSPQFKDEISNNFIEAIEIAAPLHDIGKIAISDSILFKKDFLNSHEIKIMKTHVTLGAALLEDILSDNQQNEFLKLAIDIAKYHHEEWSGKGYPYGIKATDIPLCARIVSIADYYDHLVSGTVYNRALSHEESIKSINEVSGVLFDPEIIKVFNMIQHRLKR